MTINAYPLAWPIGWKRSAARRDANFTKYKKRLSVFDGVERVLRELEMMGRSRNDAVISTNVETRLDGLPRSDRSEPKDPGVAVYWQDRKGGRKVMAIDHYTRVADNLAAVAATLEAMRAIERHGGAMVLERAFTGFTALPAPTATKHWRDVLSVPNTVQTEQTLKDAYRRAASKAHPDRKDEGGSDAAMAAVNAAYEQARRELGYA